MQLAVNDHVDKTLGLYVILHQLQIITRICSHVWLRARYTNSATIGSETTYVYLVGHDHHMHGIYVHVYVPTS